MPIPPFQSNLLTLHEIYTRTELWKDRIYYLTHNPYLFPKNNGQGDFLPLPKRFAEIITEFRNEVSKQKSSERPEGEREQAQSTINQIYKEIKEIIQQTIEEVENYELTAEEDGLQALKEKQSKVHRLIKDIQAWFEKEIKVLGKRSKPRLNSYTLQDLQPFLKETSFAKFQAFSKKFKVEIRGEVEAEDLPEPGDEIIHWEPGATELQETNLLDHWQTLNGGLQPLKDDQLQEHLLQEHEKEKQDYLKNLKLGLNKKTISQFSTFNQTYLDNNQEVQGLLDQWEEQRKILLDRKNICFILEDNDQYLKFCYQPPPRNIYQLKGVSFLPK